MYMWIFSRIALNKIFNEIVVHDYIKPSMDQIIDIQPINPFEALKERVQQVQYISSQLKTLHYANKTPHNVAVDIRFVNNETTVPEHENNDKTPSLVINEENTVPVNENTDYTERVSECDKTMKSIREYEQSNKLDNNNETNNSKIDDILNSLQTLNIKVGKW